jgi:hypothetical protein
MAEITVNFGDNSSFVYKGVPDTVTKEQAIVRAQKDFPNKSISRISREVPTAAPPEPPARREPATMGQVFLGGAEGGVLKGVKDPLDAGAQLIQRLMPSAITDVVDYIPSKLRESSNPYVSGIAKTILADPRQIDKDIAESERTYQKAREATAFVPGQPTYDTGRLVGNVVNPVTYAMARVSPTAATSTGLKALATGLGLGGVSGALTPVTNEADQKDFAVSKATQTGIGAGFGGLLPASIALTKSAIPLANRLIRAFGVGTKDLVEKTDQLINAALHDAGQTIDDIPEDVLSHLKERVSSAFKTGKNLDPAQILRELDFKALGLTGTRGQITRDPTHFAQERNLRGISGVGEPLAARFEQQNKALQGGISRLRGVPSDVKTAGERIANALAGFDKEKQEAASAAYKAAENETGIKAEVPLIGLAQDIPKILENYGSALPDAVITAFKKFGIFGGQKTHVLTMQEAENILKQTNKLQSSDPARNNALKEVNQAVKRAIGEASDTGGPFAKPRALSAERFKLQSDIPALEAAADKSVAPDDFVRKYVFNAPSDEVTRMAALLKVKNPAAYNEARTQIGDEISRAAFGENVAADALINPTRLATKIRQIGPQRLKAFFTDDEINELNRITRVGAYINSTPGAAPVNYSNTAAQVASDLFGWLPSAAKGAFKGAADQYRVVKALTPKVKPTISPQSAKAATTAAIMATMGGAQSQSRGK